MKILQVERVALLTGHRGPVYALCPTHEGSDSFYTGAGDGWVVLWHHRQPDTANVVALTEGNIFSLCHLPARRWLIAGNMYGGMHWIDLHSAASFLNIQHHQKGVFDLLPLGKYLYSIGGDGKFTEWQTEPPRPIRSLHLTNTSLRCMAYHPRRNEMAIGASDWNIYIVDLNDFSLKHTLYHAHANSVFSLCYHPDGVQLLSGGRDAHLKVWDTTNQFRLLRAMPAHWFTINHIAFHPRGHLFATASRDKSIRLWDSQHFELLKVIDTYKNGGHTHSVNRLLWLSDDLLASCSDDKSVRVFRVAVAALDDDHSTPNTDHAPATVAESEPTPIS